MEKRKNCIDNNKVLKCAEKKLNWIWRKQKQKTKYRKQDFFQQTNNWDHIIEHTHVLEFCNMATTTKKAISESNEKKDQDYTDKIILNK